MNPDVIRIHIVAGDNEESVENIAVRVKLFARHKNDYPFIPPLSNEDGRS
ncbi:MAG: hypothetical protein ACM3MK_06515 [Chitinophagales bacterium]